MRINVRRFHRTNCDTAFELMRDWVERNLTKREDLIDFEYECEGCYVLYYWSD